MLLMKKIVIFAGLGVLTLLASCGKGSAENVDLVGQWSIRAYNPVEMSSYSLVETDRDYRFEFDGDGLSIAARTVIRFQALLLSSATVSVSTTWPLPRWHAKTRLSNAR